MKTIAISIRDKIAINMSDVPYICGNSDFLINFDFDEEWNAYDVKTARFIKDDRTYQEQVFQGNECPVPVIYNTNKIRVGVFAGNLHTSTPAIIPANKGILCVGGSPEAPSEDVYAQIMEMLNNSGGSGGDSNGESGGGVSKASELENDVPFVSAVEQSLTDDQKAQARKNIGSSHIEVEYSNIGSASFTHVIVTDADGERHRFSPVGKPGTDGGVWVPQYDDEDSVINWEYHQANELYPVPNPVLIPTKTSDLDNDSGFISAPTTASVGQTIVVSEVDKNGKPTKWEAGEFGSGGFSYDNSELIQSVTFTEETKLFCVDLDYSKYQAVFATIDVNTNSRMYLKIAGKTLVFLNTLYNGATLLIIPFSDTVAFVSYDTTKGSPYGSLGEKQNDGLYCSQDGISFDRLELEHETAFAVGDKIEVYGIAR